ncbi:MAG: hypothetical protein KF770_28595 [Anaerolineae bacterium]|nr:hypothetical protein [Anaerolineae bacterium]
MTLEADGTINIYDLEKGIVIASYEGLEIHYAMLELQNIQWEERMLAGGWMKDNVNLTGWQRIGPKGKLIHISNADAEAWRGRNKIPPPF